MALSWWNRMALLSKVWNVERVTQHAILPRMRKRDHTRGLFLQGLWPKGPAECHLTSNAWRKSLRSCHTSNFFAAAAAAIVFAGNAEQDGDDGVSATRNMEHWLL